MKLTKAQRVWLSMAAELDGLKSDAVHPGSSWRLIGRLENLGLIVRCFVVGEGDRFYASAEGRRALTPATHQ